MYFWLFVSAQFAWHYLKYPRLSWKSPSLFPHTDWGHCCSQLPEKNEEERQEYKQEEDLHLHAIMYLMAAQTTVVPCGAFLLISSR